MIRTLAAEHDAPMCEPYVTLSAGGLDAERALVVSRELVLPPGLELNVEAIGHSEQFTKTLFVQFHRSPELQQLSDAIQARADGGSTYELNPHLSLIYKDMAERTRADIAATLKLPMQRMRFDRVKVITGPDHTKTRDDVEAWQTIAERPLS